jgi:hypothetical protein
MGDDITIGVTEIVNNIEVTAQPNDQIVDISVTDNADNVTLNITPTVVEVNINKGGSFAKWGDLYGTLSDQTDLQNALNLKANLVGGKVPASELPSYVDDIIEVANYAALPATGEIGKIYVTLDNNKIYRWSGSVYIEIASNSAIWGAITGTLSSQTDLQNALNAKQNTITLTTTGTSGSATLVGSTLNIPNYTTDISGLVPYTGATGNVDLGSHKLTASDLVINHASGSGVAASIKKGGSGEALTVLKTSGSGNAASILGGVTLLDELNLNTDLSILNGGTGSSTASGARTNLGATTVGANIFTSTNPSPITTAYLQVKPDNSVEWLEANAFRIAIGAGTGNGTVTSVEAVGGYGGLTLTGTVTGSGQLTLGGTPTGSWPISITGNAASVNTVQVSTNADFYLTFADANNGSPTSEFLYTIGTVKVNPSTGALTAGSFVKSGGTSSQFLMADGSVSTGSGGTVTGTGTSGQVAFWDGTSSITGESNLFWDATNDRLGIGTTSPSSILHLNSSSDLWLRVQRGSNFLNAGMDGTGAFYNTNTNHTFYTQNGVVNAMHITSGGNVGIGTTSPAEKLEVNGSFKVTPTDNAYNSIKTYRGTTAPYLSEFAVIDAQSGHTNIRNNALDTVRSTIFSFSVDGTNTYTERMRITSGGNVLIGTTTDAGYKLDVNGSGRFSGDVTSTGVVSAAGTGGFASSTYAAGVRNPIWRFGNADGYGLSYFQGTAGEGGNDTIGLHFGTATSAGSQFKFLGNGNCLISGSVTAAAGFFNSDMRLKNLTDYNYKVSEIKPISYYWKDGRDNKKHVGYSAQEVQKVMPDAVNEDDKGFLSVNYVEVLVAKIEAMEKEIAYLKSKI